MSDPLRLGNIDSTEVYFCRISDYANEPVALSAINSVLVLMDASRRIDAVMEACMRAVILQGAVHVILMGEEAYAYEDVLDTMIVQSQIERLQHATICTYPVLDNEEAINLAVCIDEQAVLVLADDLGEVLPQLLDFGMEQ